MFHKDDKYRKVEIVPVQEITPVDGPWKGKNFIIQPTAHDFKEASGYAVTFWECEHSPILGLVKSWAGRQSKIFADYDTAAHWAKMFITFQFDAAPEEKA